MPGKEGSAISGYLPKRHWGVQKSPLSFKKSLKFSNFNPRKMAPVEFSGGLPPIV
jgi:hypothetical protein